jgi:excisionase family DNA binding protein
VSRQITVPKNLGAHSHPPAIGPIAVTVNAAAALMGLGISSTWKLIHSGRLPALHVGRRCLVKTEDIHRLIDSYVAQEPTRRSRSRSAATARSSA